jgi:hypothetical protein
MTTYTVFNPDRLGSVLCKINQTGKIIGGGNDVGVKPTSFNSISINAFQYMIDQIKRGIATDEANDFAKRIRCVPDIPNVKERHVKTLQQLFDKSVITNPKRRGNRKNLKAITGKDRYKGKVDYEARRADIARWDKQGLLLGVIASNLGISKSALSMANKRYKLYPLRTGSAETRRRAIIRKEDRRKGKLKCVIC